MPKMTHATRDQGGVAGDGPTISAHVVCSCGFTAARPSWLAAQDAAVVHELLHRYQDRVKERQARR